MEDFAVEVHNNVVEYFYNNYLKYFKEQNSLSDSNPNITPLTLVEFGGILKIFLYDYFFNKFNDSEGHTKLSKKNSFNYLKKSIIKTEDNNLFLIKDTIGSGSYGKVKLGINIATAEKVAIKRIEHYFEKSPRIEKEQELLKQAHILKSSVDRIIDSKLYPYKKYFIMKLADKDVKSFIRGKVKYNLGAKDKILLSILMIKAVKKLHDSNIIHADIKPDNFGINFNKDGKIDNVWLFDFGFSCKLEENQEFAFIVALTSPLKYMPDEMAKKILPIKVNHMLNNNLAKFNPVFSNEEQIKEVYGNKFAMISKASDVFMLANSIYFVLSNGNYKVVESKYNIEYFSFGIDISNMLSKMSSRKYQDRPTLDEVEAVFQNVLKRYACVTAKNCVDNEQNNNMKLNNKNDLSNNFLFLQQKNNNNNNSKDKDNGDIQPPKIVINNNLKI